MTSKVLKLHFRSNCYDLVVPDIDKCLLMDVLNDMVDVYEGNGWELPMFPVLQYSYREENNVLTDDRSLMKMFEVIKGKTIDIWVGCLEEPNFIWKLAQQVRETNANKQSEPTQTRVPEKLPVWRNAKNTNVAPDVFNNNFSSPPSPLYNQSPTSCFNDNHSPTTHPSVEVIFPSPRRSPRVLTQNTNKYTPHSQTNIPPESARTTNSSQVSEPKSTAMNMTTKALGKPHSFPHGKKMPKSTAVMKGLWVPPQLKEKEHVVGTTIGPKTRSREMEVFRLEQLSEQDFSGSEFDSEGDYNPSEMSEDVSEEEVVLEDEEGDIQKLLNQNYVDGGWEPLERNEWCPDDSGRLTKVFKNGEVYEEAEIGQIRLKLWQLFVDKEHFKDALRDFCIQEGFSLVVKKADNQRYTAECADERCNWRIHAAKLDDGHTWAIKNLKKNHLCDLNLVNNPMCNCEWAARKLLEDIRANPDIKGKTMNALLWERFGLTMATSTLYRMKGIAMKLIQGGHDESYTNLPQYCELLKSNNHGSVAFCSWATVMQPQKSLQFKSIFVSFAAQFRGLIDGCRGLVGVDGCHLKGNYGGILLSAISLDGNNEIFPVAVAVVDSENKTSWSWFFHHLKSTLTQTGRNDWTIMSDRQKGIDPSLDSVWPEVPRRYCARHLCKNFKTDFPGLLMHKLFWNVTNAYSAYSFRKALTQVQRYAGLGAVKWFKDIGPLEMWTRWKFDPTLSSDENTNNFVESFNNTIGADRCYPVLTLLEGVRRIAMVRHATRQQLANQWPDDGICPNVLFQLKKLAKDSRVCHAYPSGRGKYEIHDGRARLPVSINARTCVCGKWQISSIPCKHGIKAILSEGKDPANYVTDWFSVAKYKQAYNGNITPIPDQEQWPHIPDMPTLIPPPMKRSVGRPSRNRRREEGEQKKGKRSTTVTCSLCKASGHNSKTCKGGPTAKEAVAQQGNNPSKHTFKGSKKFEQPQQSDPAALSLINMMISGTHDQWVDHGASNFATDDGQASSNIPNKRKKTTNDAANNLIEQMMAGSAQESQSQPGLPQLNNNNPNFI